jgi:hypothetical protein
MSVSRRLKAWSETIVAHGIVIDRIERGPHVKFYCSCEVRSFVFTISATPSDWRADLNNLSWLKKLAGISRPAAVGSVPGRKETAAERPRAPEAPNHPPVEKTPVRPPWRPGNGIPQRIRDEARRLRLGLEGRRVPVAVLSLGRPVLTLKTRR